MPLTPVLRKLFWKLSLSACGSFYSCVYLIPLHFCFYYKQSMPLSLRFDTVSHLNLVISRGTHHTALQQAHTKVWSQRVICLFTPEWETALMDAQSLTWVVKQILWDFGDHLLKDLCRNPLVCCVPLITRVWGDIRHVNWRLFSLLGPQLPGLLQISNSCFVWPPSMLSAGGITATTASFWSRARACRGKENPVFKSYQYFISHRV